MPAYQGTYYRRPFTLRTSDGNPIDISTWEFAADLRRSVDAAEVLSLTTANEGFVITDGPNGRMELRVLAAQTPLLPVGKIVSDLMRTDIDPGPVRQFGFSFAVRKPVTRSGTS